MKYRIILTYLNSPHLRPVSAVRYCSARAQRTSKEIRPRLALGARNVRSLNTGRLRS